MELGSLSQLLLLTAAIVGFGAAFYSYFTNKEVRLWVDRVFKYLPLESVFKFLQSKVKDDPKRFDTHDTLVWAAEVTSFLKQTVTSNTSFDEVKDDVVAFLATHLEALRAAGVANVPDVSDPAVQQALREHVEVVLAQLKGALSGDSSGTN